jgi:tyrosine-protein kinase Etk/Wzc
MNAPHPLQQLNLGQQAAPATTVDEEEGTSFLEYWDIVLDNRWLVALVALLCMGCGIGYALLARPVYESNLLIQVEDSGGSAKSLLGEAGTLFDVKTAASAEIEILRSRLVIGQAVDSLLLHIDARPKLVPFIGHRLTRSASGLSTPGFFGFGNWVSGRESISVTNFSVPTSLEGTEFELVVGLKPGEYTLHHVDLPQALVGTVGQEMSWRTALGGISLSVTDLRGNPGAAFLVTRHSRLKVVEALQTNLKLVEKGRQSGIIDATLQNNNREKLTKILNEIGQQYVRQNIERKAAEAQKTLSFLDVQLPQFRRQLEQSEQAYNTYRNKHGTIALEEEAKLILSRNVELQTKLLEAQQKRLELAARFTAEHPLIKTLDEQIAGWNREIAALNANVRRLPTVQQDAVRLERDVKVNNELYNQLRNNSLQLQLIKEGKIGNVRLIDVATVPDDPVKPKRGLIVGASLLVGLLAGVLAALLRNSFFRGIKGPQEIEAHTGLTVYSTIPLSQNQAVLAENVSQKAPGVHVLSTAAPHDVAVESLRSLRTALQFAMLDASNNCVLITGATPGVGKSFVSANFAAVLASGGKRVLLVDADLRRGHLNQYFGLQRKGGLSELIAGNLRVEEAIHSEVAPNLDVLTTGALPPNPAEVMLSTAFNSVLQNLAKRYDIVIFDSAPILAAADTLAVAPHFGTLLLVARAGTTQLGELHETARRLAHAGKQANGVLLNAIDLTRRHYGSYSYRYGGYRYRSYTYDAAN